MEWKVFGVSENTNSFGLYGVRLLNKQGHFYTVGASSLNCPKEGDVIEVSEEKGRPMFEKCLFEIPERHFPDAPSDVINAVW